VTTGWYSPYQQYSPIQIKYVPVAKEPVFSIFELMPTTAAAGPTIDSTIQIAQLPGKPAIVQQKLNDITSAALSATQTFKIRINTLGKLGVDCADVGEEFNPMTEKDKYGRANPFQDPKRGRIDDCVPAATTPFACDTVQPYLLQNLAGDESLIGRSLTVWLEDSDDTNPMTTYPGIAAMACCVLARGPVPVEYQPKPYPYNYGHANQGHYH